jgi:hypothetical protein
MKKDKPTILDVLKKLGIGRAKLAALTGVPAGSLGPYLYGHVAMPDDVARKIADAVASVYLKQKKGISL